MSDSQDITATESFRDEKTGLIKNVRYVFNEDGTVNWRRMIKPEFLVINQDKLTESQKVMGENISVSDLQDFQMLILLGGIKNLASLRGFNQVDYTITSSSRDYVCCKCTISWIPNFETENRVIYFSSIADAHAENTDAMGYNFLASIAENRSFVRCVRNFLKINILGKDEIQFVKVLSPAIEGVSLPESGAAAPLNEYGFLQKIMNEKSISFDMVKQRLIRENVENADKINSLEGIPSPQVFKLIEAIKKFKKA